VPWCSTPALHARVTENDSPLRRKAQQLSPLLDHRRSPTAGPVSRGCLSRSSWAKVGRSAVDCWYVWSRASPGTGRLPQSRAIVAAAEGRGLSVDRVFSSDRTRSRRSSCCSAGTSALQVVSGVGVGVQGDASPTPKLRAATTAFPGHLLRQPHNCSSAIDGCPPTFCLDPAPGRPEHEGALHRTCRRSTRFRGRGPH
jgi:hypothetical protein